MPKDTKSIDDLISEIDANSKALTALREQAIQQLLAEREAIEEKLAKLGYSSNGAGPAAGKKRKRRTKAELEAAKGNA